MTTADYESIADSSFLYTAVLAQTFSNSYKGENDKKSVLFGKAFCFICS